jgi:hypothetical protein
VLPSVLKCCQITKTIHAPNIKSMKITKNLIMEAVDISEVYLLSGENKSVDLLRSIEI